MGQCVGWLGDYSILFDNIALRQVLLALRKERGLVVVKKFVVQFLTGADGGELDVDCVFGKIVGIRISDCRFRIRANPLDSLVITANLH